MQTKDWIMSAFIIVAIITLIILDGAYEEYKTNKAQIRELDKPIFYIHSKPHYIIEIDCGSVEEPPHIEYPKQAIELCKIVYPDLWSSE